MAARKPQSAANTVEAVAAEEAVDPTQINAGSIGDARVNTDKIEVGTLSGDKIQGELPQEVLDFLGALEQRISNVEDALATTYAGLNTQVQEIDEVVRDLVLLTAQPEGAVTFIEGYTPPAAGTDDSAGEWYTPPELRG